MRHTPTPTDETAIECSACGKGGGSTSDSGAHCSECGRFATEIDDYCLRHDVDYGRLTGYDHCPRCRQENDVHQRRQEQMARRASERMHSTVDAPRF